MAAETTVYSNKVNVKLNDGSSGGNIITKTVSLGTLARNGFDATKALNISVALEACLTKEIYAIEHVQTSRITPV